MAQGFYGKIRVHLESDVVVKSSMYYAGGDGMWVSTGEGRAGG